MSVQNVFLTRGETDGSYRIHIRSTHDGPARRNGPSVRDHVGEHSPTKYPSTALGYSRFRLTTRTLDRMLMLW